ncbi:TPA: toxin YdaT family protein [Enterobacter asburiae]
MHSLAYQQGNKFSPTAMIYQNRREPDSRALNIDGIRAAVRAWAADCRSREFVAALIVEEWRATGGTGLDIPTDSHRQMQKVFRWIDGDTEYAANNIRQLAPAIMSVLPLE